MARVFLLVIDGFGVRSLDGLSPSSLDVVCAVTGLRLADHLPTLCLLGLPGAMAGQSHYMTPLSVAIGSEEGHREMFGYVTRRRHPIPNTPLPESLLDGVARTCGCAWIGNVQGRGKEVIPTYYGVHRDKNAVIVYRGYDSTVVVTGGDGAVTRNALYDFARHLRAELSKHPTLSVKKVIARPIEGGKVVENGRRDYLKPIDGRTLLRRYIPEEWRVTVNRKVEDVLCLSPDAKLDTQNDLDCLASLHELQGHEGGSGELVFFNLEDFDRWAHQGQSNRCAEALVQIDAFLAKWLPGMRDGDWLIVTADHGVSSGGGDTASAHVAEAVPVLCASSSGPVLNIPPHAGYDVIGRAISDIAVVRRPLCLTEPANLSESGPENGGDTETTV